MPQYAQDADPTLAQVLASVVDAGLTLSQRWANVTRFRASSEGKLLGFHKMEVNNFDILLMDVLFLTYLKGGTSFACKKINCDGG